MGMMLVAAAPGCSVELVTESSSSPSGLELGVLPGVPAGVVLGASQCQWSPWGSQPIDSVGLGAREPLPAAWS